MLEGVSGQARPRERFTRDGRGCEALGNLHQPRCRADAFLATERRAATVPTGSVFSARSPRALSTPAEAAATANAKRRKFSLSPVADSTARRPTRTAIAKNGAVTATAASATNILVVTFFIFACLRLLRDLPPTFRVAWTARTYTTGV